MSAAPDDVTRLLFKAELDLVSGDSTPGDVVAFFERLKPHLEPIAPLARELARRAIEARFTERGIPDARRLVAAGLSGLNGKAGKGNGAELQGQAVAFADPDVWPEPVDGAEVLERIRAFISRFLGLPPGADILLAAFAVYTYALEAFAAATYVVAHSPAPQAGKTRLLEVLALLVRRPWRTIVPSTAVLFRVLQEFLPTLLLDEAEVVRGRGDAAGDVRALLQSGYRAGAFVPRCVGDANEVRNFRVFGPKVFALIGELPPALFDRCIRVEMQRRPRGEGLARFRPDRLKAEALELARQARRWAEDHRQTLGATDPPTLAFLDERQEEIWAPIFAVGLVAAGGWYERLVDAAKQLSGARELVGVGVELLADIWTVFNARGVDRLTSADLAMALNALEGHRWAAWNHEKGTTPNGIARLLRDFRITPKKIWIGDKALQGYVQEQFLEAWAHYPPVREPEDLEDSNNDATISGFGNQNEEGGLPVAESPRNPGATSTLPVVPVQSTGGPGLWSDVPLPDPDQVARDAQREDGV